MTTTLNYAIEPAQVFVATKTDLTLTISNPVNGAAVIFEGGRDPSLILVTIPIGSNPSDLTTADTFTVSTDTSGFSVLLNNSQYQVVSSESAGSTLNPGQSIVVIFSNIQISTSVSNTQVAIEEAISTGSIPTTVNINKVEQALGIYAWISPLTIGESASSTLWWQTTGGTTVTVDGSSSQPFPPSFPIEGDPPHTSQYPIDAPIGTNAQTTYTLQVFADGKAPAIAHATLTKHIPVITSFHLASATAEGGIKIGPTETAALVWTSVYATAAYWTGPLGQRPWYTNPASSQYPAITPGLDLYNTAPDKSKLPCTAIYTLKLTGYDPSNQGQAVIKEIGLDVQKVELAYFKYANSNDNGLSGMVYELVPKNWPGTLIETGQGQANKLTIYQPGGINDVYYLGAEDSSHPQIQYFAQLNSNGSATLKWITANLTALTLNHTSQTNISEGDYVATTSGHYTLIGTAENGETVQSILSVVVT